MQTRGWGYFGPGRWQIMARDSCLLLLSSGHLGRCSYSQLSCCNYSRMSPKLCSVEMELGCVTCLNNFHRQTPTLTVLLPRNPKARRFHV
jgi:hypothetical protein